MKVYLTVKPLANGQVAQRWFARSLDAQLHAELHPGTHWVKLTLPVRNSQALVDFLNKHANKA